MHNICQKQYSNTTPLNTGRDTGEQLASLLHGIITRQYSYNGSQYLFTLYADNGPEAFEPDRNGRYLVVRNCVAGTYTFYIE